MRITIVAVLAAACGGGDDGIDAGDHVPDVVDVGLVPLALPTVFRVPIEAGPSGLEVVSTRFEPFSEAFFSGPGAVVAGYGDVDDLIEDFAEVSDGARVIEPGATFRWPFVAGPRSPGVYATTLVFQLADGEALSVGLTAEAPTPEFSAPTTLDFGTVAAGVTKGGEVAVSNRGEVELPIEATFTGDVFHTPEPQPFRLAAATDGRFEVAVQPLTDEPTTGTLTLTVGEVTLATVDLRVNFPKP